MKIYFRLLAFCKPLGEFVPIYLLVSILSILFGLLNFTLLMPLLDILFKNEAHKAIPEHAPAFSFSGAFITQTFNYYFLKQARDYGQMSALYWVCGVLIVSVVLSNIFRYISSVLVENLRSRAMRNIRNTIFDKALDLHVGYFTNERKGDIMARLTTDVQEVDYSVANTFASLLKEPITLVAYLIMLFFLSFRLTLFAFIVIPVSAVIIGAISKQLRKDSREAMNQQGYLLSLTEEALSAIRLIKGFGAAAFFKKRFHEENQILKLTNNRINRRKEAASPFSEFSGVLVVAIILVYGGGLVLSGSSELSASSFVTYLAIFSQIMRPAKAISNSFSSINKGLASGERILGMLSVENQIKESPNPKPFKHINESIQVQDLSFTYGEQEVLAGINFTIPKGTTLAIVGPSGSGKSTLADLLMRFYDPQAGQILIDGVDLRSLSLHDFRARIGLVSQDTVLFNDTIFNNIAFGRHASSEEVERAARIANAHEFIMELPQGYSTGIGDRGSRLSGGQRQRLSIARAVLADPKILILDEATSALDTESERLVQEALNRLLKGRTCLVIAHRLSTIRHADQILVLERGRILEKGSHDELLAMEGLYSKLNALQS